MPGSPKAPACRKRAAGKRWSPNSASGAKPSIANCRVAARRTAHDFRLVSDRGVRGDRRVLRILGLGAAGQVSTLADPGPCQPRAVRLDPDAGRQHASGGRLCRLRRGLYRELHAVNVAGRAPLPA